VCLPRMPSRQVIPEGAGSCQPGVVTGFSSFQARCGQTPVRGRGQGSTAGRPAPAGLALTPAPIGAESSRRERGCEVCGGRVLQRPMWTDWLNRGSGCRSSLRHRLGWHGVVRPQPGGVNQIRRPRHGVGIRPATASRPGCAGTTLTPVYGPGNGCARRAARRRPG